MKRLIDLSKVTEPISGRAVIGTQAPGPQGPCSWPSGHTASDTWEVILKYILAHPLDFNHWI